METDKKQILCKGKFYKGKGALNKARADIGMLYKDFNDTNYKIVVMVVEGKLFKHFET